MNIYFSTLKVCQSLQIVYVFLRKSHPTILQDSSTHIHYIIIMATNPVTSPIHITIPVINSNTFVGKTFLTINSEGKLIAGKVLL